MKKLIKYIVRNSPKNMSHARIQSIVLFFHLCMAMTATAHEYYGRVVNQKEEAVEFATVILLKENRQTAASVAGTDGKFSLVADEGEYRLKIQCLTYTPVDMPICLDKRPNIGEFKMEEAVHEINGVVVTASPIVREADRFVMRIGNHIPAFINKDAAELLQLAPGVWIDDNGISVNGSSGTKVFINNRELKLSGKELADYLRSYQSADIARIDVIPKAGAEYSADAKGGVIKIILRKPQTNGINGNAGIRTIQNNRYSGYRPWATADVLTGKWLWSMYATGSKSPKGRNEMEEERFSSNTSILRSHSKMSQKPSSATGRLGAIYQINTKHSVEAELEHQSDRSRVDSKAATEGQAESLNRSNYLQRNRMRRFAGIASYVYQIDTMGSVYKMIVDYSEKRNRASNSYQTVFYAQDLAKDSLYTSQSSSNYKIITADAMWEKYLNNGDKLSAGGRYGRNSVHTSSLYEGIYKSEKKPLNVYSYTLNYAEHIGAGYVTFATKQKRWKVLAGLRAEYTRVSGDQSLKKSYFDLFPSLNVTYAFNAMQTFMLIGDYGRSIQRPDFRHLNSNRIQYSEHSYMVGNPHLRPIYIHRINITAVYKYRYTLTVGGNLHRDLIREVTKSDPDNELVQYVIPENHHKENHYFVAISCPARVAEWCSVNNNIVGVKQDIQGNKGEGTGSHYLYFIHTTANFTLPEKVYLEVAYSGTSRLYSANSGIDPLHTFNVQLKKRLINDRLSLSAGLQNLFNRQTSYFAYMQSYKSSSHAIDAIKGRAFTLNVQYSFNSGKNVKKRSNRQDVPNEKLRM